MGYVAGRDHTHLRPEQSETVVENGSRPSVLRRGESCMAKVGGRSESLKTVRGRTPRLNPKAGGGL
jgi:hypothetical protein